ncbi:NUDIX hydrolase [Paenibacillus sabuli]|uniref:NUDIX hydrolase n=1 Tax=Paenibacillus sabuli TaxID=2772509 RepID=UPI00295AD829|nr:NUDIX hydrolase [Paenibacillus sabuli]
MKLEQALYPALAQPIQWGPVEARFQLSEQVDEAAVSNVSIIPYSGDRYVVFQVEGGTWELPGGTLEPGERYPQALAREVREELGAELLHYRVFGQFHCRSCAEQPYRPHIPHPAFTRLVGYGEVRLVGPPLNPADGEQVIAVEAVPLEEAVRRLLQAGRSDIADLYRLAHAVRMPAGTSPHF